jgi:hypothetical protein
VNRVEINRPAPSRPLTSKEELALQHFRERIHQQTLHGGLSVDSVRNIVRSIQQHPDFSHEILAVIGEKLREMRRVAPGLPLLELD